MTSSRNQASAGRPVATVDPKQLMRGAAQAAESGQAMLQSVQVMNTELVKFWIGRFDRDWTLVGELGKCRSVEEALPVQQRFVQDMVHDYMAVMPRLFAPLGAAGHVLAQKPDEPAHDHAV